jgi:glycosyltransferase involved in cell wall biosynthesis
MTNTSLGSAYIYGLKFAKGDFIVIMDADMSHHVSCFELLFINCLLLLYCLAKIYC